MVQKSSKKVQQQESQVTPYPSLILLLTIPTSFPLYLILACAVQKSSATREPTWKIDLVIGRLVEGSEVCCCFMYSCRYYSLLSVSHTLLLSRLLGSGSSSLLQPPRTLVSYSASEEMQVYACVIIICT